MKVRYFYVFEFVPENAREAPIGAWIVQEGGGFDYVFSEDYSKDEEKASNTLNRILDAGTSTVNDGFLEYWMHALGYDRCASEIQEEDVADYHKFFTTIAEQVK